jgi:hypothetical protein
MMDRASSTDGLRRTDVAAAVHISVHVFNDYGAEVRREDHQLPLGPTAVWGVPNREEDPGDLRMPWCDADLLAPRDNVHHKVFTAKALPGALHLTATRTYGRNVASSFRVLVQNRLLPRVGDDLSGTFPFAGNPEIVVQLSFRFSQPVDTLRRVEVRFTPLQEERLRNSRPATPDTAEARTLLRESWWLPWRAKGALEIYALICREILERGERPATPAWYAQVQTNLNAHYGDARAGKLKGAASSFLKNSTAPWRRARRLLSLDDAFLDPKEVASGAVGHRVDTTWESAFVVCHGLLAAKVVLPEDLTEPGTPALKAKR